MVGRVEGGRFVSPLEAKGCENVNSWPVLATQADDAVLGAAIMLPDHPQIAPESKGNLFDSTEIEEALLIHVLALSDEEREAAAAQDPAVRQMLERAAQTTPQELMDLHGRVQVKDPREGEPEAEVDGVRYRRRRQGRAAAGEPTRRRRTTSSRAARRRSSASTTTTTARVHLAVTVDDVPGQELMRDIGRFLYFKTDRGGGACMSPEFEKQILVAGVGNAWMLDDGFGSVVAQRLEAREMPSGVRVMDAGSGGLDLAYEIMRGYHALVLVDVSRQGGEPGTLYVMEPDLEEIAPSIEDGDVINPHGMDPATVLRFVRAVGGWSRQGRDRRLRAGRRRGPRARALAGARGGGRPGDRAGRRDDRGAADGRGVQELMHELSIAGAVVDTALRHAEDRSVLRRHAADRPAAPGDPGLARVLLRDRLARHARGGRAARAGRGARADALRRTAPRVGARASRFRCPQCDGVGEVLAGDELEVDSIEVEEDKECIASR